MKDPVLRLARGADGGPEIFKSIQGEGRTTGQVRAFVRLSGCNLHCVWCDTPYTWNWDGSDWPHVDDKANAPSKYHPEDEILQRQVSETAAEIGALYAPGVVITGGEPLIQSRGVEALIDALKADAPDVFVEIETNGTIEPSAELLETVDQFNVSPKLGHSGNDKRAAFNSIALNALASSSKSVFKFVAERQTDLAEIKAMAQHIGIQPSQVFVMPLGTTTQTLHARSRDLAEAALQAGFGFTDRLHIHLFGDTRST